jgi:hypothetical protein
MTKRKTPMLDELENGKWPSFVSDIKQEAEAREKTNVDLQGRRRFVMISSIFWNSLSKIKKVIGNTAVSQVFSDMVGVLLADTVTGLKNFRR